MKNFRPTITPDLLATIIDSVPNRVRRRLDKEPNAAEQWQWNVQSEQITVEAGSEVVRIDMSNRPIQQLEQLNCTCLLSPKCYHVLACVHVLDVEMASMEAENPIVLDEGGAGERESTGGDDPGLQGLSNKSSSSGIGTTEAISSDPAVGSTAITQRQIEAAERVWQAITGLLRVGNRAAGTLVQSALLRSGHDCRLVDLPTLGNTILRIAEGVRRIRSQSDLSDSKTLASDIYIALLSSYLICTSTDPPFWAIGTSRREYNLVKMSRLDGWFAEPVFTRSGYAGICVHMMTPDRCVYQFTETRPGDSQLVRQSYRGGIDLGEISLQGYQLCRTGLVVQDARASLDGRLGKGKNTRWAVQGKSRLLKAVEDNDPVPSLEAQIRQVFENARQPMEFRHGGWDLLTIDAELIGVSGAAILAHVEGACRPWHLCLPIDDPELPFRSNMEMLARCPGLRLRCVVRLKLDSAGFADLLAIFTPSDSRQDDETTGSASGSRPKLHLPEERGGLCNLGLDILARHYFDQVKRWPKELSLEERREVIKTDDGLAELDRRLGAMVLGGYRAIANVNSQSFRRDEARLRRRTQVTCANLIEMLSVAASAMSQTGATTGVDRSAYAVDLSEAYLACSTYLNRARMEFHRQAWNEFVNESE